MTKYHNLTFFVLAPAGTYTGVRDVFQQMVCRELTLGESINKLKLLIA